MRPLQLQTSRKPQTAAQRAGHGNSLLELPSPEYGAGGQLRTLQRENSGAGAGENIEKNACSSAGARFVGHRKP